MQIDDAIQLADWRRRTFDIYRQIRASGGSSETWTAWRHTRDELFRTHAQSPIAKEDRSSFRGIDYYGHDPRWRVLGTIKTLPPTRYDIATSGGGSFAFTRFGGVTFEVAGRSSELELYWLEGYGGGIFLPFKDTTNGAGTYGGGRYLLDTVKGADLGMDGDRLVLDFNFAYNPSCSYDPRWACPLSPPENKLEVPVEAGEKDG